MTVDNPGERTFGKYTILEELGRGGFGIVFRAIDTTLERPVALKILDPLLMRDRGWVERFRREARLMARLDHPHVVPIFETGTHDGRLFLAMKLIDGPDLAERIAAEGPFSWSETVTITSQIASALDYAHEQGLVHRDLKPSNVLLANGSAVLTDFGLSRLAGTNTMSVSLTGGVIGTPSYIPPEAWENEGVSGPADQYALACLVYEMLTGDVLFTGDTPPAIMMSHYSPPRFPEQWPDTVPHGINDALSISLTRDPVQRYSSCGELAAALRRLQNDVLARPYAALQRAVREKNWATALTLADQIRTESADYRDVAALEHEAMIGIASEQKAAAAVQWREQAEAALAAGNQQAARTAALQWQALSDDGAAAAFLAQLDRPDTPREETIEGVPSVDLETPIDPREELAGEPPSVIGTIKPEVYESLPPPNPNENRNTWLWIGAVVGILVAAWLVGSYFLPLDDGTAVTREAPESTAEIPEEAAAVAEDTPVFESNEETAGVKGEEDAPEPTEEMVEPTPEDQPAEATPGRDPIVVEPLRGQGGAVTVLYWQAPTTLNPYLSGGTRDLDPASVILEPLLSFDENGELIPRLAEEVPTVANGGVSNDLTSVVYHLKDGILWSDGTPFTAEDVVFTYEYCANPETGCVQFDAFDNIIRVTAVDELTVQINFLEPLAFPYGAFVSSRSPILQQAQFEGCIGAAAEMCVGQNFSPIGTGPFVIEEFIPEDRALFRANDLYRDPDKPFFSELIWIGGGDALAAAEAVLFTGEVDYAWNLQVDADVLEELAAADRGQLVTGFATSVERLMVNLTNPDPALGDNRSEYLDGRNPHPFLSDSRVRQALSLAIDRERLAAEGYGPSGRATCNVVDAPPALASTGNDRCLNQDLDLARQLLAEAGYPDGGITIIFQTSTNSVRQKTQELIAGWWADIGINTELRHHDAGVFFGNPNSPDFYGRFYADIEMYTNSAELTDIESYLGSWTCGQIAGAANNWFGPNVPRYCNPDYDALHAELTQTADPATRAEIIQILNDLLVQDGVMIPLVNRGFVSAHANSLRGVRLNPWDSEMWNIADWSREE